MTMWEILHDGGIRHGLIEVDWLGEVYPAPDPDDPYSIAFAHCRSDGPSSPMYAHDVASYSAARFSYYFFILNSSECPQPSRLIRMMLGGSDQSAGVSHGLRASRIRAIRSFGTELRTG